MRVELSRDEIGIRQYPLMQRNGGLDAFHHESVQPAVHPGDGFGARVAVRDDLGDQRVIVRRDHAIGITRGIHPNPGPTRNAERRDASGGRDKRLRILRIDPALNRVPAKFDRRQHLAKFFARRHPDLRLHQVHARNHFGHRMLHLNARVHFDEIQIAGLLPQKFHGSGAGIAQLLQRIHHLLADFLARRRVHRHRRRFLQHLLVPALQRTFPLAQVNHVPVLVA